MSDLPDHMKSKVAQMVAEENLIEVTPNEVEEVMVEFLAAMRANLRGKGFTVPDSDSALMDMIKEAGL